MTRVRIAFLLVGCGLLLAWLQSAGSNEPKVKTSLPAQVIVIRHAEKENDKTNPHLNTRGGMRAAALPGLFVSSPMFPTKPARFATPDFLYAAAESKNSNRPVETLLPLAKALGDMPIHKKTKEVQPVVDLIFSDPQHAGKVVLLCWRHGTIPDLALAIAAKAKNGEQVRKQIPAQKQDDIFDRVWRFTFDEKGIATFTDEPQKLLFGDAAK